MALDYSIIKKILVKLKIVPLLYRPYRVQQLQNFIEDHFRQYQPPFIQIIAPKEIHNSPLPIGLQSSLTAKALVNTYQPAAGVWVLSNASIYGSIGYLVTHKKMILQESVREYRSFYRYKAESLVFKAKKKYLPGVGAVVTTAGTENYFHWIFDCLPRIYLLQQAGLLSSIDYLVVPPLTWPFQKESIKLFELNGISLIEADDPWLFSFDKVFFPTIPAKIGNTVSWASDFLFSFAASLTNQISNGYAKRIYLTRVGQKKRTLLNEPEIIEYLKTKNFSIIDCTSMSIIEQMALFQTADIVVSPHGAALTNITYCKPDTKIMELMDANYRVPCFWTVAKHRALNYEVILSDSNLNPTWQNYYEETPSSYIISIVHIQKILNSWIH